MTRKRIAVDLCPIRVGEGGTGSGIWTYARELLLGMDQQIPDGLELLCFVNKGQESFLGSLQNIQLIPFDFGLTGVLQRLWWVHIKLPLECRKMRVDILHKLATDNPLFCPAKRVTTVHDFYYEYLMEHQLREKIRLYERLENVYFSWVTRICFSKSDAIIAVSQSTRNEAVRRYPHAEGRITVIHHGGSFDGINQLGSITRDRGPQPQILQEQSTDRFRILCVAKFMEHKGQHLLIEAFEQMLGHHPELVGSIELRLRGFHNDADYYERICRQVEDSRWSSLIQLEDFNPNETLDEIYGDADLVVLLSDYEGFGLPVLEAQGMGIPVLCSDLPVLREVGGTGAVYVNRADVIQVAEALYRFAADSEWRSDQGRRARENLHRFSWNEAARRTLEVYAGI